MPLQSRPRALSQKEVVAARGAGARCSNSAKSFKLCIWDLHLGSRASPLAAGGGAAAQQTAKRSGRAAPAALRLLPRRRGARGAGGGECPGTVPRQHWG